MARKENNAISRLHKGKHTSTRNPERKILNTRLANRGRIGSLKNSAITTPFPTGQAKPMKEEITALKQEMAFILGVTKTGLDIIDSNFNIRFIDPEWAKVYGDPAGKKCYAYFMDRNEVCPNCGIPTALKTKRVTVSEETLVKEGNRPIQVTTIPFQDGDGQWLVAEVNVDISERKRTEEALREAREGLETRVQERTAELARTNEAMQAEISERKRTEDALRESEERYRSFVENFQGIAYRGRMDFVPIFFHGAVEAITGYKEEEFLAGNPRWNQMIHPDDLSKIQESFQEIHSTPGYSAAREYRILRKDGKVQWVHEQIQNICDSSGKPIMVQGALYDITERKRAEEALLNAAQQWRTTFDGISDIVCLLDQEGRIIKCNKALTDLLGKPFSEIINRTHLEILHGAPMPIEECPVERLWKTHRRESDILLINDRWFNIAVDPLLDEAGRLVGAVHIMSDVTERKRAEEAIRESEKRYRQVIENAVDIIYTTDANGNFTHANSAALTTTGYSLEELQRFNYLDLILPEHRDRVSKIYISQFRQRQMTTYVEFPFFNKSGDILWFGQNASLVIEGKKPVGFHVIARDITVRKKVEEALHESEERYRNILDSIQDGYSETDLRGNFTLVNNMTCKHLGYTKEESIGMNYRQYTSDENAKKIKKLYAEVYKTGKPVDLTDHELISKDGTTATYELSVSLIRNAEGNPIGFRQTSRDVTQRKKSEETLRQSEEKYRNILEHVEEGYYEEDLAGNFTFFNDSLCQIYGSPGEELLGLNYKRYTDKETARKLFQVFNEIYRTGNPSKEYSYELIRKDGSKRYIEASASLIKDAADKPVGFRGIVRDVTERKKMEQVLLEREEQYRTLLETMEEGYYEVDLAGKLTFVNDSFSKMHARENMLGMTNREYMSKETARRVYEIFNGVYKTGHPVRLVEWEIIKGNGQKAIVEASVYLINNAQGERIGFRGIERDITERKRAEEALRQSEERYRTILETMQEAYYENDLAGHFTFVNDALCRHLGYSKEELIGKASRQFQDEANTKRTYQAFNEIYRTGEPVKALETEYIRKDGTKGTYEVSASLIRDAQGKPFGFRGVSRDVTERKQAEEALRHSEERYRTIIENIQDGYFENDLAGNFTFVNDVISRHLRYTRDELIGMNYRQYTDEENAKKLYQHYIGLYRTGQPIKPFEAGYVGKDGTKLLAEISVSLMRDSEGKPIGFRGISRDITERKQAEEEKLSLQEQLRQSQKMEAIGQLAGGVAHDFNNLLTVIKGYSQLSLLDLKEDGPLRGNIQEIEKATQRATDLTRQLLAFSRRQILDLKVLDLNVLLKDLEKMLRRIIGEDIQLITLLSEDLGKVKIDPSQIEQVIFNLAVNARDAMPSGGKLAIETANVELDEEYAHAHVSVAPGRYVRLSVSDTGVGMTQEVKEKVFEPFFTTKEKGKGTGLGLSMVYGIVKQSNGNIWLYSEPGRGTTFRIYFPRTEEEADTLRERQEAEFFPRGSETVLLVEDDELVRDLAIRLLGQQGYRILHAANGQEALQVAKEHLGETIHLLLTDIVMPQMGGKELSDWLRISRPNIKVLFTSGYADNAIVHHGVLDRGTHFLQKPFSLKTLSRKVREVLDG
jgi:PAS domain S-box-containing protein